MSALTTNQMNPLAIRPARRTSNIRYAVRDIVALAEQAKAAGRDLLSLNVGDPNIFDFAPPPEIIDATLEAMRANHNGYAPSSGIPEAIDAINREAARKGITSICHTYVTSGASEAIDLALSALADPGDNVLVPSPGYPFYTAALARLNVGARNYALDESRDWGPDVEMMRSMVDEHTRAIVLINPNNPTGSMCATETLKAVLELAREHNLVVFSDEIYDKLVFDGREHVSTASLDPAAKVITFNGLSKAYVVPGFRIGWGVISGPADELEDYCEAIRKMERARLSANHPEQHAIPAALDGPNTHLPVMMEKLTRRRDITVERLNAIPGISCVSPDGAFYAFPRIDLGVTDEEFCRRVILETGVVIVPGSGFGQAPDTQHFRVVFLPPDDVLDRAYDAIAKIAATYA